MEKNVKVKLKVDLTRYLTGLIVGSEGYTVGTYGKWSRLNDNFTGVKFSNIGTLDVLIDSLEIIDEEYLKKLKNSKNKELEDLKTAENIEVTLGVRGGFKYLSYKYCNGYRGNGFKKQSEELIAYFKSLNKEIKYTYL